MTRHSTFGILIKRLCLFPDFKVPKSKMAFNGKYKRTTVENMEALMDAMELPEDWKKAMLAGHPTMEVIRTENKLIKF